MKVYLGLGTNLGDKELNLRVALQKIEERIGKIISLSAFYALSGLLHRYHGSFRVLHAM